MPAIPVAHGPDATRLSASRPVPRGEALPHRIGIRFWPETWDGSDVFVPEASGFVFVTERVRDALTRAKAKNVEFKRITEVEQLVAP